MKIFDGPMSVVDKELDKKGDELFNQLLDDAVCYYTKMGKRRSKVNYNNVVQGTIHENVDIVILIFKIHSIESFLVYRIYNPYLTHKFHNLIIQHIHHYHHQDMQHHRRYHLLES